MISSDRLKATATSFALCAMILALCFVADAQPPKKVPRIGHLDLAGRATIEARNAAFRQGLRDLGYVDGQNIVIEYRSAQEQSSRLPALAAELVQLNVDVIVTQASPVAVVASKATKSIPIINAGGGNLLSTGVVTTLAQPGGNVTGLTSLSSELNPKRLELLKEILPTISRVAVFPSPAVGSTQASNELKSASAHLKIELQILTVQDAGGIPKAFAAARKAQAGAVMLLPDPTGLYFANSKQMTELSVQHRLPIAAPSTRYANSGALEL